MKKILFLFTMFVALFGITQSCSDEQEPGVAPRKVSFSLGLLSGDDASGRKAVDIPEGASVLITLKKTDGTAVLTQERINILRMGEGIVTAPIRLAPGDYTVTDFWVVQDSSDVLFLIPQAGSPLAQYVSTPVSFQFSVDADNVTSIPVQVVSAQNQTPENFGYASFGLSVVDLPDGGSFRVAVFVASEGGLMLTDAEAVLLGPLGPFATHPLEARINTIKRGTDSWGLGFTLRINKPGYVSFERRLEPSDIDAYKIIPLEVVLEQGPPAGSPSMEISGGWMTGPTPELDFRMEGAGVLYVEWGNGFMEKFIFDGGVLRERYHIDDSGPRTVTARGDLDKIVSMAITGLTDPGLLDLDIHALVNLKHFIFGHGFISRGNVADLDLSSQTRLDSITLEYEEAHVILPSQHNLRYIHVRYWTDDYSVFVGNIYSNAVAKDIRNGIFHYEYPTNNRLPQDVIEKLEILREDFGWDVRYN